MAESEAIAATGKPLTDYEPFVEILAAYGANILALATTDIAWLSSLDRSVPLEEALKDDARETIRWRLAHHIEEIKAQLEAQQ